MFIARVVIPLLAFGELFTGPPASRYSLHLLEHSNKDQNPTACIKLKTYFLLYYKYIYSLSLSLSLYIYIYIYVDR